MAPWAILSSIPGDCDFVTIRLRSDRFAAAFAGADADAVFQRQNEDLAVADSPAAPVRPPRMMASIVGSRNSSLTAIISCTFRKQVDGEFVAAVDLGVAPLAAEALHVHDGQAKHLDVGQGALTASSRWG